MRAGAAKAHDPHVQRLALLRPFIGRLLIGLLVMALTVLIQLTYPKALSYFIDNIEVQKSSSWFSGLALVMLLVLTVQALATACRYYIFETTGFMIVTKVRRLLYGALIEKPIGFYDRHSVGELSNRLSADVEVLHDTLTMGLAISLRSLFVFAGGVVMLLVISPALSVMLVVFVPASLYLGKWAGKKIRHRAKEIQAGHAACGSVAHEHFTNIRLVHAFNQYSTALAKYFGATEHALALSISNTRFLSLLRGVASFLVYVSLLATLWFGASLIGQGTLSIGELTAFILYAGMVTDSSGAISEFWSEWMRTVGATERIFEMIESGPGPMTVGEKTLTLRGDIAFDHVDFSYPERPEKAALKGVSFIIEAGQNVALVGASGAGKSTIASLLLGFYGPDRGRILFDGMPHSTLGLAEIRHNVAIVEQEPSLFSGSIFENIAFAVSQRDVTEAEVRHAAKMANAHEFIESFPDGYNTIVGDRGAQLSGGQKQRIAIARAMLRNPRILILDEATSALDSASEMLVQHALDKLMEGRTTLIIAHRYSTIVKADRILVLANGTVSQQGVHQSLIQEPDGLYFQLMENQMLQTVALPAEALGTQPALQAQ